MILPKNKLALPLLLLLLVPFASVGTWAGAPCPSTSTLDIATTQTLASGDWTCKVVRLHADVTITAGSTPFKIDRSTVLFDAPSGRSLVFRVDGKLDVLGSTFSPNTTVSGTTGRFFLGSGATVNVDDASLFRRYDVFQVNATAVTIRSTSFVGAATDAIRIVDASPTLSSVTVEGGTTGIRLDGSSNPTITGSSVSGAAGRAFTAAGASRFSLVGTSLCSGDAALFLTDAANGTMERGGFCGGQALQVRLLSSPSGSPGLTLKGVPFDAARVQRDGQSWLTSLWFVIVEVTASDLNSPLLQDAKVFLRNATGFQLPTKTASGRQAGTFEVPFLTFRSAGTLVYNPWTVFVSKESSAGKLELTIDGNREGANRIVVPMTLDNDGAPPAWPTASPLSQTGPTPGYSKDGSVQLSWPAADDTVNGAHPNRDVQHYQISRSIGSENTLIEATGTSANLSGLSDGTARFRVRPVDLANNAGPYSNEVSVIVDRAKPRIEFITNRTGELNHTAHRQPFNLTLRSSDPLSGLSPTSPLSFRIGAAAPHEYAAALDFVADGVYNVTAIARDRAGNVNETKVPFVLDRAPPLVSAGLSPAAPDGSAGWYRKAPKLIATASDSLSGVYDVRYRYGSGSWHAYAPTTNLTEAGDQLVSVQVRDQSGNAATTSIAVKIDATAPTIETRVDGTKGAGIWYAGPVDVHVTATETDSGIESLSFRLGTGAWAPFQSPLHLDFTGSQQLTLRAMDRAGNPSKEVALVMAIDTAAPVPPLVRWTVDPEGRVHAHWDGNPAIDLASGLSGLSIEQADGEGRTLRSFNVPMNASRSTVGPLAVGSYKFRVSATDAAGNTASTLWTPLDIHTSIGGLQSVADRLVARRVQEIAYAPADDFVPVEVFFYVDDELVAAQGKAPFSLAWDTRQVDDGVHTVRIVARDQAGNVRTETLGYEVRNSYGHVIADNALPFGLAVTASLAQVAGSIYVWRRWRIV